MKKIQKRYRREDSSASAGRLFDILRNHFAANQIFMDEKEEHLNAERREERAPSPCLTLFGVNTSLSRGKDCQPAKILVTDIFHYVLNPSSREHIGS
jgi:hypothetical protein